MTIRKFFDTDSLELCIYKLTDIGNAYLKFNNDDIIRDSIKFNGTLMKELKSSSSTVSLSIKQSEKSNTLTAYNGELKVTLSSNEKIVFSGYLSNKMSFNVNTYGIPSISLTLEDVGTKLFKKELYPDSLVDHYFTGTLYSFVKLINTQLGGISYSASGIENDTRNVSCLISSGSTIESLLQQVCFELGFVYYFNAGVLTFYKIPTDADASETVTAFAANGDNAIQISKEIRKYKTSRITTNVYESASNVLVYRDNSGGSDSSKCNVLVKSKEHYPELSDTGEPAEYDCEDLETGKELISVDNLTPTLEYSGGNPTATIKKNGASTITVDVYNDSSTNSTLTKLECRADVVRVKSTEIVKSSIATLSQESDNVYEAECKWIHSKADCEYLAKVTSSYFNYCDTTYSFYLLDDVVDSTSSESPFNFGTNLVGKVVTLKEDTISGLNVNVLITSCTIDTSTNVIKYNAVGYSKFNMTKDTSSSTIQQQNASYKGEKGDKGDSPDEGVKFGFVTVVPTTYEYSLRSTDDIAINVVVEAHGVKSSLCPVVSVTPCKSLTKKSSTVEEKYQDVSYQVTLTGSTPSTTITWSTEDESVGGTYEVTGTDITDYYVYLGKFDNTSSVTTTALSGDCIYSNENGNLYIYENKQWVLFSQSVLSNELKSRLLGQAQEDVLKNVQQGTSISSEYAYLIDVITKSVTTSALTMTDEGIIQSSGITSSSVGADGYLTAAGYRLEGNTSNGSGVLRAKDAYINNLNSKDCTLTNATITGELTGKYINTVASSSSSSSFSIAEQQCVYENSEVRHYIVTTVGGSATSATPAYAYSVQGSVYGFSIDGYTIVAKNKQWGDPYGVEGYDYKLLSHSTREWNCQYYCQASDSNTGFISYAGQSAGDRKTLFPDGTEVNADDSSKRILVKRSDGSIIVDTMSSASVRYVNVTSSLTNQFKSLATGVPYTCSGTVKGGGTTLSGTLTVTRSVNSTTFSQGSSSVTIPDTGKYYGGNLYVSVTYQLSRAGIETGNIYAKSTTTSIGENSKYFAYGYIGVLNSNTVNGGTVWGAVFN